MIALENSIKLASNASVNTEKLIQSPIRQLDIDTAMLHDERIQVTCNVAKLHGRHELNP